MKVKLLRENLEKDDLKRLVTNAVHIDQFKSKMGDDADICVASFKVKGKEPANDLVAFLEKGYDFILDADVSSGEQDGGDYLVFVEMDRAKDLPGNLMKILEDITNLTEQKTDDWTFTYYRDQREQEISEEALKNTVVLTPEEYRKRYEKEDKELDQLKTAAGVDVTTKAPVNDFTESIRIAAGIK